jgi:predicted amidohydrolase YtcJ
MRPSHNAAAAGCTSLHDVGLGSLFGAGDIEALTAVMRGDPPVRYSAFLVSNLMETWLGMGLTPNTGNDRFRLTGIKLWSDGSNQGLTGYQREPYLNSSSRGSLNYTLEQITETMQKAHDLGSQLGVHANGDAGIDTTLQAFASVLTKNPRKNHRHRIEHCSLLHEDQIQKMKELEISPSFL